jgi:hypothetical protein
MMQNDPLRSLLLKSGSALGTHAGGEADANLHTDPLCHELAHLLSERNGFFAFESALRVFPSGEARAGYSLDSWNSSQLWRSAFRGITDECLFFAEDILGSQFCIHDKEVHRFDPETASFTRIAGNLTEWARLILKDPEVETGYPLAHEWQRQNGALAANCRLVPKVPFACGGEFEIANLVAMDAVDGMKFRASIAMQIRDLPDGAEITFRAVGK